MRSIAVAYGIRGMEIGQNGRMPWEDEQGRSLLTADTRRFMNVTMGKAVIMGATTYDSIPEQYRPLKNRQNIVLSLSRKSLEGAQIARSLEEAYELAETEEAVVIGGARVYREALPFTDTIYATEVLVDVPSADAHFDAFNPKEWTVKPGSRQFVPKDDNNEFPHGFVTYVRNDPIQ